MAMKQRITRAVFAPCRGQAHCEDCKGSFFDEDGYQVLCTCAHHKTVDMFAPVISKQKSLF